MFVKGFFKIEENFQSLSKFQLRLKKMEIQLPGSNSLIELAQKKECSELIL